MTKAKVIALWLDETSDSDNPAWVVSRDILNGDGEAETSDTIDAWCLNDHDDAYEQARDLALDLARKDGLCVIKTNKDTSQTCIYAPKIIAIHDGIGHMLDRVRLYGDTLEGPEWANGCVVTDEMDDDTIVRAVREAWTEGHEGGRTISIEVETEQSIIER